MWIRIGLFLLLILSLAGIQIVVKSNVLHLLFVLDVSQSIPVSLQEQAKIFIQEKIQEMDSRDDRVGLLVFGKDFSFEFVEQKANFFFSSLQSEVNNTQTDIAGALKLAIARFPESGQRRIVLMSDGNQTLGDALKEAQQALSMQIPVDVIPLVSFSDKEIVLEKFIAPHEVNEGQAYDVTCVIHSSQDTHATLRLSLQGEVIREKTVALQKGKNSISINIPAFLVKAGFQKLRLVLESKDDSMTDNNAGESFTYVEGTPKILYLEGDWEHKEFLLNALTQLELSDKQRVEVRVGGVGDLPRDILGLQNYDALILSNIARDSFSDQQMLMIESAVKEAGMGFVMIGGEQSFGAGGYAKTPIERILPVDMDITHKKIIPNGALVLVLHTCEFPEGNTWAKRISQKAIDMLSPYDLAGILYFDWQTKESWLFPLMEVTITNKSRMFQLIQGAEPGDMPAFEPTLQAAYQSLLNAKAGKKHIVVITDGDPTAPTVGLIQKIKDSKISISGIVIQPHGDEDIGRMRYICGSTGGNYYRVDNPEALPAIFTREALSVKRNLLFESEKGFYPVLAYHGDFLRGIGGNGFPKLFGYVVTTPKPLAYVPLYIEQEDQKDPLLAYMQHGLGRTVAFTSDAKNKWASDWVKWKEFQKFWVQTVQWALRKIERSSFRISTSAAEGKGKIAIEAVSEEGKSLSSLVIRGVVVSPDGMSLPFEIEQTGLGRYEGNFPAEQIGTYLIHASYLEGDKPKHLSTGLSVAYSSEYLNIKPNFSLLSQIANTTKGRMLSLEENKEKSPIFLHGEKGTGNPIELWSYLIAAFLILFPLDVFFRRVHLDHKKIAKAFSDFFSFSHKGQTRSITTVTRLATKTLSIREERRKKREALDLKKLEEFGKTSSLMTKEKSIEKTAQNQPIPSAQIAPKVEEGKKETGTKSSIEHLIKVIKKK